MPASKPLDNKSTHSVFDHMQEFITHQAQEARGEFPCPYGHMRDEDGCLTCESASRDDAAGWNRR